MKQSKKRILSLAIATTFWVIACGIGQPNNNSEEAEKLLVTSVAQTLTAIPTDTLVPTEMPSATPTEIPTTTQIPAIPTIVLPTSTLTEAAKPDYACNIIDQRPFDDTSFRPGDSFDIKWTIVNTGTRKWEGETYLKYQNGPEMTEKVEIELPQLKPGGEYDVILDATAPSEEGMQVMVWAVIGPGVVEDSIYWMCYPYVRIIVK